MYRSVLLVLISLVYLVISFTNTIGMGYSKLLPVKTYIHSHECQAKNYLLLDCWDRCNGDLQANTLNRTESKEKKMNLLVPISFHCEINTTEIQAPPAGVLLTGNLVSVYLTPVFSCYLSRNFPPPELV